MREMREDEIEMVRGGFVPAAVLSGIVHGMSNGLIYAFNSGDDFTYGGLARSVGAGAVVGAVGGTGLVMLERAYRGMKAAQGASYVGGGVLASIPFVVQAASLGGNEYFSASPRKGQVSITAE